MNAKHLSKFSIFKKLILFGVIISVAIIAAFSICATAQANAEDIKNGAINTTATLIIKYDEDTPVVGKLPEPTKTKWHPSGSTPKASPLKWEWGTDIISAATPKDYSTITLKSISCWHDIVVPSSNGRIEDSLYIKLVRADNDNILDIIVPMIFEEGYDFAWAINGKIISDNPSNPTLLNASGSNAINFTDEYSLGDINITGVVTEAGDWTSTVPFAFVQYCRLTPWGPIPVPEMSTFTDFFGRYTIEGIDTEEMLPGVIRVYKWGYEVGESLPIYYAPDGTDTIYRTVLMTPEQPVPPVPPVPPTPPDPPTPPVPPQPVPPVPTPTPTPVDPGTNIPQTGDTAPLAPIAALAVIAVLGCGFAIRKEF